MESATPSAAQFYTLANLMPTLCWMANKDGWIHWYNRRWYEYTGTSPEQMEGWGWQSVHDPAVLPEVLTNWRTCIEKGQPFEMTFPIKSAEGHYRPFLTRVTPVKDDDGDITGWLGVNTDVTQEREASNLREQFMAVLGHDLRNPLHAITTGLSALQKTALDPRGMQVVLMMRRSANRMVALIQDVMDMARTRLGSGIDLSLHDSGDLGPVLQGVIDELMASQPERVVVADLQLLGEVHCDHDRIAQLFSNLLGNAFTYGAADKPIRVHAKSGSTGLELSVGNEGLPIPPAELDRLFQPFFRGVVRPNRQGLGLGLYIAQEIAHAHGGSLEVTSTMELTCFTFRMPTAQAGRSTGPCVANPLLKAPNA